MLTGRRDVFAQLVDPGVAVLVGSAAGDQPQGVGLGVAASVELGAEAGAQRGVGDEDVGRLQSGEVECLGRRGARDRAGGHLRAQRGEGRRAVAGKGEVGVDLVGYDDDAVAGGHLRQLCQFVSRPHAPHRIVRIAQEQQSGAGARQGRLQCRGIAPISAVGITDQRHRDDCPAVRLDDLPEGVVDGLLNDDGVAGAGQGPHRQCQGGHDAGGDHVPGGVDPPVVAAGEPAGQGGVVVGVRFGVAEDSMAHPPEEGGGHAGRGGVVHVRHPQGQGRGGAASLGGEVPLEGAGAGAVVDQVERGEVGEVIAMAGAGVAGEGSRSG